MVNLQKPVSSPIETDQTLTTALSEAIEEKGEIIEQLHDISALAAEIRLLKGQTMQSILQIGTLLIEAKEQLIRRGQWINWLKYDVDISVRNAERYMQLSRAYANSTSVSNLTMTKALLLLEIPEGERESFLRESHQITKKRGNEVLTIAVERMTTSECREAVRAWQKADADKRSKVIKSYRSPQLVDIQKITNILTAANQQMDSLEKTGKINAGNAAACKKCRDELSLLQGRIQKILLMAEQSLE